MEKESQRPFWTSARSLFLLLSANASWWCGGCMQRLFLSLKGMTLRWVLWMMRGLFSFLFFSSTRVFALSCGALNMWHKSLVYLTKICCVQLQKTAVLFNFLFPILIFPVSSYHSDFYSSFETKCSKLFFVLVFFFLYFSFFYNCP